MKEALPSVRDSVSLVFLPQGISVTAAPGDTILDAALDNQIDLAHECGGNCACTTCHVTIAMGWENLSPMEEAEAERLNTAGNSTSASRLACQALLQGGPVTLTLVETE